MDKYKNIIEGEVFIINKSKFIGYLIYDFQIEMFVDVIEYIKKKHKRAKHFCYGYSINSNNFILEKYSDHGEPKGTAGIGIISSIKKQKLDNIMIIIVRYFGGKKLGYSVLLRSYIKSSNMVILEYKNNFIKT